MVRKRPDAVSGQRSGTGDGTPSTVKSNGLEPTRAEKADGDGSVPYDGPTPGDIWAMYTVRKADGLEVKLRNLAENFRILTRMDQVINIPDAYKATTREVRTPFVRDAWLRITASLTHNDWLLHVEPKTDSDRDKRGTGVAERWTKAACTGMSKDIDEDVDFEACKAMVRDGESVIKTVHRPDAWADFPQRTDEDPEKYLEKAAAYKKGAPLPFAWRTIDRLSVIPGDGEWGDDYFIEYQEYPRPFLAGRYQMTPNQYGYLVRPENKDSKVTPGDTLGGYPQPEGHLHSSTGRAVKIEYWDQKWYCVLIDGVFAPGFPKVNPYAPRMPYSRARPDVEVEPVLYSLLFLVPRLDEVLTMWINWAHLGAFPIPILQDVPNSNSLPSGLAPPTGDDSSSANFTFRPGKYTEVPRGKQFSFLTPPPVGQDIKELGLLLRSLIDIAGIPSIFRGLNVSGDSGYLANQMLGAVEMQYKRLARARARQLEKSIEFIYYLIPKRIKTTVFVQGAGSEGKEWLGLRPTGTPNATTASIDRLGAIEVEVRPDMAVMQQARAMIARQLTEGDAGQRLDSRRHAMEHWLGYEDPDRIIDEIWVEEVMNTDPTVNKLVVDNAIRIAELPVPQEQPALPAATGLVGPDGQPIGGVPGAVAGGLPVAPGMGMPFQPTPPAAVGAGVGGRPEGAYPGQPPNAPQTGG